MNKNIVLAVTTLVVIIVGGLFALSSNSVNNNTSNNEAETEVAENVQIAEEAIGTSADEVIGTSALVQAAALEFASCGYTDSTTEGPYYVSGTRLLEDGDLNYQNLSGDPLKVGGYVYASSDKSNPVSNVKLEIWHADNNGGYYPESAGDVSDFDQERIQLRGYVVTDENGYYEFDTIYPGEYSGRTRHMHIRASGDAVGELFTQIILHRDGDALAPANDNVASTMDNLECAWPTVSESSGAQYAPFNIYLN